MRMSSGGGENTHSAKARSRRYDAAQSQPRGALQPGIPRIPRPISRPDFQEVARMILLGGGVSVLTLGPTGRTSPEPQ